MLLAVAGLDQKALEERTRLLASRDWGRLGLSGSEPFSKGDG
jgi:hypothetical protein